MCDCGTYINNTGLRIKDYKDRLSKLSGDEYKTTIREYLNDEKGYLKRLLFYHECFCKGNSYLLDKRK